jgi:hypothetical protein
VHRPIRQLRGLAIAIAALALSAGFVLAARPAAMPDAAGDGLARASDAAGKVVPVRPEHPTAPEVGTAASDDTTGKDDTTAEDSDTADATAADAAAETHGSFVSEAAKADTPDGFDNHGQYVRTIAQGDDGKPAAASTGEAASTAGRANKPAAPASTGHGHSDAARASHP